jgi:hypothetical protein
MRNRWLASLTVAGAVMAAVGLAQIPLAGQSSTSFTPPRTAWGHPDLQGVWDYRTMTPLQRAERFAGKEVLTDEEAAAFEEEENRRNNRDLVDLVKGNANYPALATGGVGGVVVPYNEFWYDRGSKLLDSKRTSLIVDPPDGRIPRRARMGAATGGGGEGGGGGNQAFANPEELNFGLRCTARGMPRVSGAYNNNIQIVQSPNHVALTYEMAHDTRLIPLDGRPHLPPALRQSMGDSRGRWEGDTLVVETVNFLPRNNFQGASAELHLTERFKLVDAKTMSYEFTVKDDTVFTRPWTVEFPMLKNTERMYEYGCQENNYALIGILGGTREQEKRANRETATQQR